MHGVPAFPLRPPSDFGYATQIPSAKTGLPPLCPRSSTTAMSARRNRASLGQQFRFLVRALRHRNYRLYYAGQLFSMIGTWMQFTALGWLVYRLTDSEQALGVVAFARQFPIFLFSPLGGVLADRWNRRNAMLGTQALSMLQAFTLGALTLSGRIDLAAILVLAVLLGIINSVDMPMRHALVVHMIEDKRDLSNALALNSSIMNGGRVIGPAVAGTLIAVFKNEGYCFVLNGFSFLAVLTALAAMRFTGLEATRGQGSVWRGLGEGLRYVAGSPHIRSVLLLLAVVSLFGFPYAVLMPVFAREILGRGEMALGFLTGGVGVGALLGFFYLASRRTTWGLERAIPVATVVFGAGLAAFSLSRSLPLSLFLTLALGFGMMVQNVSINTVLQSIVDEDKRGRVMALFTMSLIGMAPFGNLLMGTAARYLGTSLACLIGGSVCLAGGLFFLTRLASLQALIRPIYESKGIRPNEPAE